MFFDYYPYTNFHNVNLDWVLQAVKSWGAMVETNNQGFIDLKAANASFKTYVTTYLQNLDVSDEINDKLDQMLADGVLAPYMAPYIQSDVSAWLTQHITPTTPAVDNSLTISGAAADAKVTGERFTNLNSEFNKSITGIIDYAFQSPQTVSAEYLQGGINSSGANTTTDTRVRTVYMRTYNGLKIIVPDGYKAMIFYYSTASGSTFTETLSGSWLTGVVYVPPRSAYFRMAYAKTDDAAVTPETIVVPEIVQYIYNLETSITQDIQKYSGDLLNSTSLVDGYITANGSLNTNVTTGEKSSGYIKVRGNAEYILRVSYSPASSAAWVCAAFYGAAPSRSFISRAVKTTKDYVSNNTAFVEFTFQTTADTDFIRVSFSTHEGADSELLPASIPWYAESENQDDIPDYFTTQLNTKIPEIISNSNETGSDGLTFAFITDLHWETNYKLSPLLMGDVLKRTGIKYTICGGDMINQGTDKAEMCGVFFDCINQFKYVLNNGFFPVARGNHDDNSNWTSTDDITAYHFDDNTLYNLLINPIADRITRFGTAYNFYFDDPATKSRFLFIDTKRNGLVIDVNPVRDELLALPAGYHAIIIMHFALSTNAALFAGCDMVAHMVAAYNTRSEGSYTGQYQSITYNFTSGAGTVDLILGGHQHLDLAMSASDVNNPSGVPIIATDTDSNRTAASVEYTVNSQCFDVITINYTSKTVDCVRIGRGNNRTFTY